jgi:hypothetical protein
MIDTNPKSSHGRAKPSLHFIPPTALLELAGVMALGAYKYGAFNWRKDPISLSTYLDAIDRHKMSRGFGEKKDRESLRDHAAHIMACAAIILDADHCGTLIDDLPKDHNVCDLIAEHGAEKSTR